MVALARTLPNPAVDQGLAGSEPGPILLASPWPRDGHSSTASSLDPRLGVEPRLPELARAPSCAVAVERTALREAADGGGFYRRRWLTGRGGV